MEPDDRSKTNGEATFFRMFGTTEAELTAQGIDVMQYIQKHAKRGMDRLYDVPARKLAAGESVLPYEARAPYISGGRTFFSRDRSGRVTVDRSAIRLFDADDSVLAQASPADVTVYRVGIWLGIGVRLVMGPDVAWLVQPRGFPNENIWKARRANKVFRAALSEAGARFARFSR